MFPLSVSSVNITSMSTPIWVFVLFYFASLFAWFFSKLIEPLMLGSNVNKLWHLNFASGWASILVKIQFRKSLIKIFVFQVSTYFILLQNYFCSETTEFFSFFSISQNLSAFTHITYQLKSEIRGKIMVMYRLLVSPPIPPHWWSVDMGKCAPA